MSDIESSRPTETAPANVATPVQAPAPVVVKGGRALGVFAILIALLAAAGSAYTWYATQVLGVQQESRLAVGVSEIGAQVTRMGDQIVRLQQDQAEVVTQTGLNSSLLQMEQAQSDALESITQRQQAVEDSVLQLGSELERGVDQFIVEEVSQLMRLANNSVLFGRDIDAAVNALALADNQLKGLKDPRYAQVRTQINTELSALALVNVPDTEALSARLHSLSGQVPDLPLLNEPVERGEAEVMPLEPEAETTFQGELKKIWHDLINSVSIQRVDQPPKPLLVPEQRYFLNENIRLALAKAELALLQEKPELYQRSLEDAEQWLRDYFDLGDATVTTVLNELSELSGADVAYTVPDITGSYQALQTILGGR